MTVESNPNIETTPKIETTAKIEDTIKPETPIIPETTAQPKESKAKIVQIGSEASCFNYELQNEEGEKIATPKEVTDGLNCPIVLSLSPDKNFLLYMKGWELKTYDLAAETTNSLMSFLNTTEGIGCAWSNGETRIACVSVNQENYDTLTKIFVLYVDEGKLIKKKPYNNRVSFTCGASCYPEDFSFESENILNYTGQDGEKYVLDLNAPPPINEKAMGYIKKVYEKNGKRYLEIDYVQLLNGVDEIVPALKREKICVGKEVECAETWGFYITNQNKKIRTYEISEAADIRAETYEYPEITFDDLITIFDQWSLSHLKDQFFNIEIENNLVIKIHEETLM